MNYVGPYIYHCWLVECCPGEIRICTWIEKRQSTDCIATCDPIQWWRTHQSLRNSTVIHSWSNSYSGKTLFLLNPTRNHLVPLKRLSLLNMDHWINFRRHLMALLPGFKVADGDGLLKKMVNWQLSRLLYHTSLYFNTEPIESRSCDWGDGVARSWCLGTCILPSGIEFTFDVWLMVVSKCQGRLFQGNLVCYELEGNWKEIWRISGSSGRENW